MKIPTSWQAAKFADIQTFSDDSDITSGVFKWIATMIMIMIYLTNNKGTIEVQLALEKDKKNTSSLTLPGPTIDMKNWKKPADNQKRYKNFYKVGTVSTEVGTYNLYLKWIKIGLMVSKRSY